MKIFISVICIILIPLAIVMPINSYVPDQIASILNGFVLLFWIFTFSDMITEYYKRIKSESNIIEQYEVKKRDRIITNIFILGIFILTIFFLAIIAILYILQLLFLAYYIFYAIFLFACLIAVAYLIEYLVYGKQTN